ncbi:hypothetical protein DE146DRAFT_463601 [Phaeosphaeria sp. MPI-PUGE-AT-0046c]|nr:hypothetical protein DE146DRAFT_463601 [Phaeosphaeria sp. MPI-PUGE-AT-0046c]
MNNPNFQQNQMGGPRTQAGLQHFISHYRQQLQQGKVPPGWQQSVPPEERGQLGQQFYTQYRMLKSDVSEMEAMRASVNFETQTFMAAHSKDQYMNNIKQKLMMMTQARAQRMQGQISNPMGAMNNPQMGIMPQQNAQNPRQGTPQQFNPAFPNPQLQRPMQVSSVPMGQNPSSIGMNNGGQPHINQGPNAQQANMQAQQNRQESAIVNQFAKRLMDSCKDEIRQRFQLEVQAWPEDKKQQLVSQGINPLFFRFRQHAEMLYKRGALSNAMQTGQPGMTMQPGGTQMNLMNQMNLGQRQNNPEIDYNAFANQQIEAMRVQDQGGNVVPASNNLSGSQMTGFPQQGQQTQPQNNPMAQRQVDAAAFQNNMQRHAQQVQQVQNVHQQAQAQAHVQLEQQRQQQAAQARAQAQNRNMIGGMGVGLNTSQSPAPMSMLNRPMHPPGQPGPQTPQQQPQNHVPLMKPRPGQMNNDPQVSALLREAQQRANVVAHAHNQPLTEHARMAMIPQDLEPQVKAQLLKVPEQQFLAILQQYVQNARRTNIPFLGPQVNQPFNPQQAQQGMANPMMAAGNMARPGLNIGQQTPGAGPSPAMNQRPPQPANQQQRLATAHHMLRQSPGIISATDSKPYPPNVLNPAIKSNIPPDVKTWGQLKQWASQNPNLMPGVNMEKLILLQALHFQDLVKQQGGINATNQLSQNNLTGIAPQPPQMQPQGPMRTPQQPPNMGNVPMQVTPQEIMQLRQNLQAKGQGSNATEEQLRTYIMNQKRVNHQRQQQAQQQAQQQQQQQQNLLAQQQQQRAGQQQQQQVPGMVPQPNAPNRPPTTQPQNGQAPAQAKANARPQQPNQANAGSKKRPIDDTMDATKDANMNNAAPQAPAMVPNKSGPGLNFTAEQMSKMKPEQQARMKAQLLKAQDPSNAAGNKMQQQQQQQRPAPSPEEIRARMNDPVRMRAFNQIVEEVENSMPARPVVPMPPQLRATLQKSLKDQLDKLKKLDQAMRVYHVCYDGAESEGVVRQIAKARALLFQQMNIQDGTLHDQVTLSADEFRSFMRSTLGFFAKITTRMAQQQSQNTTQQSQPAPGSGASPAQLNAANLKIVEEQEQEQRQHNAPSAPTTDRPPFALGDQSARGAPTYFEGAKTVTNLVLPDKKRTKLDTVSQSSTPGPKASPRIGAGKGQSSEHTRQSQPDKQAPQRPTFRCKASDCEYSVRGFDTQAALDSHVAQMHVKIENPLQFALESMAEFLDVDPKTGDPKVDPNAAKRPLKAATTASRVAQPIKTENAANGVPSGATPVGFQAAATPMARVPTQPGMKSSPVSNFLKTPQAMAKIATPSTSAHAKATPTSMPRPAPKEQQPAAPAAPEKEEELPPLMPMSLLDYSYEDTFAALDANGPFTVLDLKDEDTTWALRSRPASPMTTPESSAKDTPSTRTSDISENDNLQITLDMDMPDAWAMGFNGNALPIDMQLSEDMQTLGVVLPPMDNDDMMLFPSYNDGMMDLDALEKTMESMGDSLDMSAIPL